MNRALDTVETISPNICILLLFKLFFSGSVLDHGDGELTNADQYVVLAWWAHVENWCILCDDKMLGIIHMLTDKLNTVF